jgi:uncharacterized membrane protein
MLQVIVLSGSLLNLYCTTLINFILRLKNIFLKIKFYIFLSQINIFFIFLDYCDVLMLKIIFKNKVFYYDVFSSKKYFEKQVLLHFQISSTNNQAIYINDNIPIHITFLRIGVILFGREKNQKNTLYFPYKLILKRFARFLYFLYSSFKARI